MVTSDEVYEEGLKQGITNVLGDEVLSRKVANQIAIREAIQKYGINKIFSFHTTVESAKSFVAKAPEGIGTHVPLEVSYCVHGDMRAWEREDIFTEVDGARTAVLSNARLFIEGSKHAQREAAIMMPDRIDPGTKSGHFVGLWPLAEWICGAGSKIA